jgi:hypothetical protein
MGMAVVVHVSDLGLISTPQLFYDHRLHVSETMLNHARRLRLEKLFYIELSRSRSPNGFFKPLVDPGGRFRSEAVTNLQRLYVTAITINQRTKLSVRV